jgi:hypothetical protein
MKHRYFVYFGLSAHQRKNVDADTLPEALRGRLAFSGRTLLEACYGSTWASERLPELSDGIECWNDFDVWDNLHCHWLARGEKLRSAVQRAMKHDTQQINKKLARKE